MIFIRGSILLSLFARVSVDADKDFYRDHVLEQRRHLVFNSRWLSGECLPVCLTDEPTFSPTPSPTSKPTMSPTPVPTKNPTLAPTLAPTKNPTLAPTQAPTPGPTKNPTLAPTLTPTPSPTTKPTSSPTPAPTEGTNNAPPAVCPVVNFDFSDLANGDWIHDQFWNTKCVKVTAFARVPSGSRTGFTPINGVHVDSGGAARVYDTGIGSNCDEDLMTPSPKFFDGPNDKSTVDCKDCCGGGPFLMDFKKVNGVKKCVLRGSQTPNPYKNDKYLGNVLIIQNLNSYNSQWPETDDGEMSSCPDDAQKGGHILFEFCQPVSFNAGRLLDVDGTESAKITFYYADGSFTNPPIKVPPTGDNGHWNQKYSEKNVVAAKFEYTGSGSVEGVEYSYCPTALAPTFNTTSPTNNPTISPTPLPTPIPTSQPTPNPTPGPTKNPTQKPTSQPTSKPTPVPTKNPTPSPTSLPTQKPTSATVPASDCEDMMNLGYGFSAATHDTSLGATSHFGQDGACYPPVQKMSNPPKALGYDDSIAVLIGGNYNVINGAELEGNVVVMGSMHIGSSGLSNLVSVGWGSQIVPHSNGKCVQVGGDLSSDRIVDVFYGTGKCNVVYKGVGRNDDKWRNAKAVIKDASLDLSKYAAHIENLRKKSKFWATLPTTPSTSANVVWGRMTFTCSPHNEIQVFNIQATVMTPSKVNDIYVFTQSCLDKTILMNIQGTGEITLAAQEMRWTDAQGTVQRGGWENFNSCMNSNILWNFPDASKVIFDGDNEWNGSILITGDFVFKTIGQSGRTMVLGSVTQDRGGSEFHSFQFKPPMDLPEMDCASYAPPSTSYGCVWPKDATTFTLISKSDSTSAAHSHYTKVAVGGTFTDGSPNESGTISGKIWYGSLASNVNFIFKDGKQQISDLKDVPIDYAHFEWLANNIQPGTYGDKIVFVVTSAKASCYNLFDFVNGGQGGSGEKYLVVFKTSQDVCFTKTSDGRQFGPTILAPFSKVTLMGDAGYVDGTVIAKTFTTSGGNAGNLQMHGKFYSGPIECQANGPDVASLPPASGCNCDNTNSPVAYSWKCGLDLYYCANVISSICTNSMASNPRLVPLNDAQCAQMNNVKLGEKCLVVSPVTQAKDLSHKVCYSSVNPLTGAKYDGSCDVCQGYTPVGSGSGSAPSPTPAPSKNPTPFPSSLGATGCCSQNWKDCLNNPGWCGYTKSDCDQCGQTWLTNGPNTSQCLARWGDCTNNKSGCCAPGKCVKKSEWWWSCE